MLQKFSFIEVFSIKRLYRINRPLTAQANSLCYKGTQTKSLCYNFNQKWYYFRINILRVAVKSPAGECVEIDTTCNGFTNLVFAIPNTQRGFCFDTSPRIDAPTLTSESIYHLLHR